MARTLTTTLTTAVGDVTRVPVISATCEDHIARYNQLAAANTAQSQSFFGACIASDGSIIRVWVVAGSSPATFQYQRITNPSVAAQWTTWTTFGGASATIALNGACCVSNNGGMLRAFAQQSASPNSLWTWSSTDNGVTWSASPTVVYTPVSTGALMRGLGSGGNNDLFIQYDVVGGKSMGMTTFSGSWSALAVWPGGIVSGLAGVAVAWDSSASLYRLVYSTATEIYSFNVNSTGSAWSNQNYLVAATANGLIHQSPFLLKEPNGTYTVTYVDSDSGTITGASFFYPRVRQSTDFIHWSNGYIFQDANNAANLGIVPLYRPTDTTVYMVAQNRTYTRSDYSQADPTRYLDMSTAILSYKRTEHESKAATIELELDNTGGAFNSKVGSLTSFAPINIGSSLVLNEGYKTGAAHTTPESVKSATFRMKKVTFERGPSTHRIKIVGVDASYLLDAINHFQIQYAGQTVAYLITEICARAGLFTVVVPGSSTFTQTVPIFILQANRTLRATLNEVCQTYNLRYFIDQDEKVQLREFSVGDASVWTYQPEVEVLSLGTDDEPANHVIVTGAATINTTTAKVSTGEAYDMTAEKLIGRERIKHVVDMKLTTPAQCALRASSILYQEQRATVAHYISVPLNPALQLHDPLTLTDYAAPKGTGQSGKFRINAMQAEYSAQAAKFEHTISLEGA